MRRRDKLKNIVRANILAEQRYLKSKGIITEDEQKKIELVGQMTKEIGKRLATKIKKMGIDGNGYQMGIKGEGLNQYLEMTFNTAMVDYNSQFNTLETEYLNHLRNGLVRERGLGGEYKQYVDTSDPNSIKWAIKYTPPEQLQGEKPQTAEQRYLESKGVLTEGIYSLQDFIDLVYNQEKDLGEKFFVVLRNGNIKFPSNNEPFIDKAYLKQLNIYDDTEIDKIINLLSAKKVAPDMNTVDGRIQGLNDLFKTAGSEGDYVEMRDIYNHFENNGEINNLPSNLRVIYNRAYKPFTKEEFMKIFLGLDKTKGGDIE